MDSGEGNPPDDVVSQLADCQDDVEQLKRENKLLRDASRTFGALAERLNKTLEIERRRLGDRRATQRSSADRRTGTHVPETSHH